MYPSDRHRESPSDSRSAASRMHSHNHSCSRISGPDWPKRLPLVFATLLATLFPSDWVPGSGQWGTLPLAGAQELKEVPGKVIPIQRQRDGVPPKATAPLFRSRKLTAADPSQDFDISLEGVTELYLVANDAGDGYSCDWADWLNLQLVKDKKSRDLTELEWTSASAGWNSPRKNTNVQGQTLSVRGEEYLTGIGTHATSVVHYKILGGYERLTGTVALDDGGLKQGCGSTVQFEIYDSKPNLDLVVGHSAEDAVSGLDVAEGLEVTLFAAEPDIRSITNIDIDPQGRVWACEVMNYRGNNGSRPEGDRILILEDTDHDGVADIKKVFYQGRDIDSAMGICVFGKNVVVSASPNIWLFTDSDGDDVPDQKRLLFSETGQAQHDHSAHSFVYGPDGKLYWNFGNTGQAVHDASGNTVEDPWGQPIVDNGKPYFGGMIFRCNPDGSQMEVLAHNFRNNYETAVDSFGSLWQSDNDDDGNRGVRINYVMEYGNYGYRDQSTGDAWTVSRMGMSDDVPLRHWHLNDPGVVPNLLQTGAGSPCAITVYEGRLLPERYWDQLIHCDAGPNVVRSYPVQSSGAGFTATILPLLTGTRDRWFRPVDPCVAPDGSLFVSDWYDPGVGGHGMGDLNRGRIFRIAPPGMEYRVPEFDFATPDSACQALTNPALSVRAMAHQALEGMGTTAEPALERLLQDTNPRLAARALWILGKGQHGRRYVNAALESSQSDTRIVALRIARQMSWATPDFLAPLAKDPSPQVRREVAVALNHSEGEAAAKVWLELAKAYQSGDRWMLEALGVAADHNWNLCLAHWLESVGDDWSSPASRDIIWRSRADQSAQWIVRLIDQPDVNQTQAVKYFRALEFQDQVLRDQALTEYLDEE